MNSLIVTPTPNLDRSLEFYRKLGFKEVAHETLTLVTDGKALLQIDPERTARAGVKLFGESWKGAADTLSEHTKVTSTETGFFLGDPNGVRIQLVEGTAPAFEAKEECFSHLGGYAGMSLECADFERSVAVWTALGCKHTMGNPEQGWSVYVRSDGFGVSLMSAGACPHLVFNPSLTYFNGGNNLPVIAKIREVGIPITEEITHFNDEGIVDNVIIRDPGGLGFYVFND